MRPPCTKPSTASHVTGYRTYGCRCVDCTAANTLAIRRWRYRTGRVTRKLVPVEGADSSSSPEGGK